VNGVFVYKQNQKHHSRYKTSFMIKPSTLIQVFYSVLRFAISFLDVFLRWIWYCVWFCKSHKIFSLYIHSHVICVTAVCRKKHKQSKFQKLTTLFEELSRTSSSIFTCLS